MSIARSSTRPADVDAFATSGPDASGRPNPAGPAAIERPVDIGEPTGRDPIRGFLARHLRGLPLSHPSPLLGADW